MATAKPTTDHDEIRKWVEARGGHPARVKATGRGKDPGILRIDFPGFSGQDTLEEIEWDEFFDWFDRNNLALLLSSARGNRFNKLVERTSAKKSPAKKSSGKKSSGKKSSGKKSSAKKASAGKSSAKKSAAKTSSAKTSSAKKASAGKSSGKKASAAKTSSAKTSSAKKSSARKSSARTSSAKKSSAKKSSAKKSSAKKTSAKKTSARKSSSTRSLLGGRRKASSSSKKSTSKKSSGGASKTTTNHDEIRRWVEARGGFPATVAGTESRGEDAGLLRIDYPGYSGKDTLEHIDWEAWLEKFDEENLAFLYQDKRNSRFSKLVRR